ncbi:HpcH/HpaI aldolase/citrate lyase family protein [Streptomyces sp. NPDC004609]|uniref:HpcH/HpaI aldolase/citrate lyase family protein n=1 Tax=Streptomyces sp. NPDC004609 TaxID=3364704 RepID=UPI0036B687C7
MAERTAPRPRSCLSVPGGDERKILKAWESAADEIVIDLEDAVPVPGKAAARETVRAVLDRVGPRANGGRVAVRVNAPRTPWCHLDLLVCAGARELPDSVVVPKAEGRGDIAYVERLLDGAEAAAGRGRPLAVQALIETAAGLGRVRETAAESSRLRALVLGYADLGASLGRSADAPPEMWLAAQERVLAAGREADLAVIDGPYLGIADDEGLMHRADWARRLGFDGKWAVHPRQLDTLNAAFTPTEDETARARAVLAALDEAVHRGAGATLLDGQMLDEAVAVAARDTLARAALAGPAAHHGKGGTAS